MDSRLRPARYKQPNRYQPRVPPRYNRNADVDIPIDELGVKEIFRGLSILLIATLIFLTVQRYLFEDARDPFKCSAIVNEGRWLYSSNPDVPDQWQPPGCLMHTYDSSDLSNCLADRQILFVGDSHIKALYLATLRKLSPTTKIPLNTISWEKNEHFVESGVTLDFIWDPYLNTSDLKAVLKPWKNGTVEAVEGGTTPAIMLVGAGFWFALKEFENPMRNWRLAIDDIAGHMRWGPRPTWLGARDTLFLAPAANPPWKKLPAELRLQLNPQAVIDINKYLNQLSTIQGLDIPRSWRFTKNDGIDMMLGMGNITAFLEQQEGQEVKALEEGMVLGDGIAETRMDMLLNLRCNDVLVKSAMGIRSGKRKDRYDRTCCIRYPPPNFLQSVLLFLGLLIIPVVRIIRWNNSESILHNFGPSPPILQQLWYLLLGLIFCFYIDRTPVFNKSHKLYDTTQFWRAILVIVIAVVASLQKPPPNSTSAELETRVWNEWKGVALAIHLISAYQGLSVKFSTFALLFVFSAEQTVGMLRRSGGLAVHEFAKALVSLNIMAVPLVFMMRTDYSSYKLPALYTIWYCVIAATMKIGGASRHMSALLITLGISACVVMGIFMTSTYSWAYSIAAIAFRLKWDIESIRVQMLRYIWAVYGGMLLGIVCSRYLLYGTSEARKKWEWYSTIGVIALAGSWIGVLQFGSEELAKGFSTYTVLARLATFAILKLGFPIIKARQSEIAVTLGSFQIIAVSMIDHAWLAGDGTGIADLGIWGFNNQGLVLGWIAAVWIFGYACWTVRDAAEMMVECIVGEESEERIGHYRRGKNRSEQLDHDEKGIVEEEQVGMENFGDYDTSTGGVWQRAGAREGGILQKVEVKIGLILWGLWILNMLSS